MTEPDHGQGRTSEMKIRLQDDSQTTLMTDSERRDPLSIFADIGFATGVLTGLKYQHEGNIRQAIEGAIASAERVESFLKKIPYEVFNQVCDLHERKTGDVKIRHWSRPECVKRQQPFIRFTLQTERKPTMTDREQFEKWISSPPFECSVERYSEDPEVSSWPGNYKDIEVMLAWEAWQESRQQLAETEKSDKYDKAIEEIVGQMSYSIERLAEHFDEDGALLGDSKWRQRAIWEYCKKFDEAADKVMTLVLAADPEFSVTVDMRKVVEALGFDPTNHHNAAKCPYCTEQLAETPDAGDDGELADLDWFCSHSNVEAAYIDDDIGRPVEWCYASGVYVYGTRMAKQPKTRGDFRNLCKALGIELEEK